MVIIGRDYFKYLKLFKKYLGNRIYSIFLLALIGGISESFGVIMIIPLIQSLLNRNNDPNNIKGFTSLLFKTLDYIGISDRLDYLLFFIVITFLVKGLLYFTSLVITGYLTGELLSNLKLKLFDNYNKIKYSAYLQRDTGHFINLINDQTNNSILSLKFFILTGTSSITALVYMIFSAVISLNFFLISIFAAFLLSFIFKDINDFIRNNSKKISQENSTLSKFIIQSLQSLKYLRSTDQEEFSKNNISYSLNKIISSTKKIYYAQAIINSSKEPIGIFFIFSILYYELIIRGQAFAPLIVSIGLFYRSLNYLINIQTSWSNILQYIGSITMIDNELKKSDFKLEEEGLHEIESFKKGIKFQDVYFKYLNREKDTLRKVNLFIPYKSTIAFVGESGAGKSTIVDLITLCHESSKGNIYIDEFNTKELKKNSWRSKIGYVTQENNLFDNSIANNIAMKNVDIKNDKKTMELIKDVSDKANIYDFVKSLPNGFSTLIGDRGIRLSGGQKQRICIARELFRKPDLLILDEATSSLDLKSENEIQKSINSIKGSTTIIIIAHRLSTVKKADQLFLIDKGCVREVDFNNLIKNEQSLLKNFVDTSNSGNS